MKTNKQKRIIVPAKKLSQKDVKEVFNSIYMSAVVGLLSKYVDRFGFVPVSKKPKTKTKNPAFVRTKK